MSDARCDCPAGTPRIRFRAWGHGVKCCGCGVVEETPEEKDTRRTWARTTAALLAITASCAGLPHREPAPRLEGDQGPLTAVVHASCTEANPFENINWPDNIGFHPSIEWRRPGWGHGVVVSGRHVITAAHIVECPVIPKVRAWVGGREYPVVVERDEGMFGDKSDVARLTIFSAWTVFGDVVPPQLAQPADVGDYLCMARQRRDDRSCGEVVSVGQHKVLVRGMVAVPGDSGTGVFDRSGQLVGVVAQSAGKYTYVTTLSDGVWRTVDYTWLSGT